MPVKKLGIIIILLVFSVSAAQSQILISLLFGDKLNNEKLEFGLNVSGNFTTQSNIEGSKFGRGLAIGLFFDFKMSDHLVLASSLLFNSPKGGTGIRF